MDQQHKARIARRFDAAAATYDIASPVQRAAAARLAERICARALPLQPRVLEIGCGTGHLTRQLVPKIGGDWLITDIAPAMIERCRQTLETPDTLNFTCDYRVMDGEHPTIAGPFDLIVSNLTLQWFIDLPAALTRLAALLAPGGYLAISTLGCDNFAAWRAAHAAFGLTAATPDYPSGAAVGDAFPTTLAVESSEEFLPAHGTGPLDFARHLRKIGADTPAPDHAPLNPGQLRRVLRHVARIAPAGVNYHVLYAIAQRRA